MSLRETALDLGVKRKDTCKLFYGIYPYSLTAKIPQRFVEEKQHRNDEFWQALRRRTAAVKKRQPVGWVKAQHSLRSIRLAFNANVKKHISRLIERNAHILEGDDFYYTFSPTTYTLYVKSAEIAERLLLNNKKTFSRLSDPYNDKCADYLAKADPKVIVRQNLFEGNHEFRIEFKPNDQFGHLDERVEALRFCRRNYSYNSMSRTLYLTGDEDLFLARMGLEDQIERITKCVLTDNI